MASSSSTPPPPPPPPSEQPPPPIATPLLMPPPPPSAPPSSSSSRRLPPPCWTPDETSALIDAYRDKWYALRRGNLRAAHWQDVADDVHRRCPGVSPPKTAVQCRHKMEKLRKRYRAELNRANSIPHHRFSSSWVYFAKMQSMEKGPDVSPNPSSVSLAAVAPAALAAAGDSDDEEEDADEDNSGGSGGGGGGYPLRNYEPRRDFDRDYHRNGLRIRIAGNSSSGSGFLQSRKNYRDFDENPNPNPNANPSYGYTSKYNNNNNNNNNNTSFDTPSPPQFDEGMRYATRIAKNGSNGSTGSLGMNMNMNMNMNSMMMKKKKKKMKMGLGKRERGDEAAMEMVEAIKMFGEGFVRMERMKMDMMRDTERMRMEMEMKKTEMILESQHRIVEAFAKGWSELIKNNKNNAC